MTPEELKAELRLAAVELQAAGKLLAEAQVRLGKCRHQEISSLQKVRQRLNLITKSVKS